MNDQQQEARKKRIDFALQHAREIGFAVLEYERKLWKEKAAEAKKIGLYSQSTYVVDAANALRKYAKDFYGRLP